MDDSRQRRARSAAAAARPGARPANAGDTIWDTQQTWTPKEVNEVTKLGCRKIRALAREGVIETLDDGFRIFFKSESLKEYFRPKR